MMCLQRQRAAQREGFTEGWRDGRGKGMQMGGGWREGRCFPTEGLIKDQQGKGEGGARGGDSCNSAADLRLRESSGRRLTSCRRRDERAGHVTSCGRISAASD